MNVQNDAIGLTCSVIINVKVLQNNPDYKVLSDLGWPKWVRGDKVRKISTLPILSYIHEKILDGMVDIEVARFIRQNGFYDNVDLPTIRGWISHYKATIPRIVMLAKQNKQVAMETAKAIKQQVDTFEMMAWAIDVQKKRIEQYRKVEDQSPIPIPETRKEIDSFFRMVVEFEKTKKDAGFTKETDAIIAAPQPQNFDLDRVYSREGVNKVMADPRSRFRVVQAVERIFDLVNKKKELDVTPETKENIGHVLEDMEEVLDISNIQTKFEAEDKGGGENG